jgi:hypothetical protein
MQVLGPVQLNPFSYLGAEPIRIYATATAPPQSLVSGSNSLWTRGASPWLSMLLLPYTEVAAQAPQSLWHFVNYVGRFANKYSVTLRDLT